jgi:tetratricopeptide (TPR) repeat protein
MRTPPFSPRHVLVLSCLLLASCGDSSSPEQRLADTHVADAREAFQQGKLRRTHLLLDSALTLEAGLRRPARVGEIHRLRGHIQASVAEFDSAMASYRRAGESFRAAADRPSLRAVTLDIAGLERTMGLDRRAWVRLEESLRLAGVFGEESGARAIRWAMLPAARAIENFEAESTIRATLTDAVRAEGDVRATAALLQEEGRTLMARGRWDDAAQSLRRSAEYADRGGDSLRALGSIVLAARSAAHAGRSSDALQTYAVGLRRADATRGARRIREEMLVRVGNLYLAGRQAAEAARFYRAALNSAIRLRNKLGEGLMFAQLGHCALAGAGSAEEARKNFAAARDLFDGISYPAGQAYAHHGEAMAAERAGRFSEALESFSTAMLHRERCLREPDGDDVMRECEEAALGAGRGAFASPHLELLARMGKFEEAFAWAERGRAKALALKIGRMELRESDSTLTSLLAVLAHRQAVRRGAEETLADALAAGQEATERIEPSIRALGRAGEAVAAAAQEVASRSPVYAPLVLTRAFSVQDVQRSLPRGSALLTFLPSPRSVHVVAITAGGAAARVSPADGPTLRGLCEEYGSLLQTRELYRDSLNSLQRALDGRIDDLTVRLYGLLIRPVETELAGASTVTVVAPPPLEGLPIHALRRNAGRRGSAYVVEEHAVTYLPSAFMLAAAAPAPASPGTDILALGCQGGTAWDVEYELRDIRSFFKDVRLHFGIAATFDTLLRSRADVLHLAAPFLASDLTPANASCALSDGKAFDTWKPVPWERFALLPPYPTLIVSDLGAGGATVRPEFPWILLANGTPTVIVQAYPPTRKTKKFFGEIFYTATLSGAAPRIAARQTQLEMIRTPEYASPSLWAPFMVWGK